MSVQMSNEARKMSDEVLISAAKVFHHALQIETDDPTQTRLMLMAVKRELGRRGYMVKEVSHLEIEKDT